MPNSAATADPAGPCLREWSGRPCGGRMSCGSTAGGLSMYGTWPPGTDPDLSNLIQSISTLFPSLRMTNRLWTPAGLPETGAPTAFQSAPLTTSTSAISGPAFPSIRISTRPPVDDDARTMTLRTFPAPKSTRSYCTPWIGETSCQIASGSTRHDGVTASEKYLM